MKSYNTQSKDIQRSWHLIDLKDKVLGREATKIASLLIGKKKLYYAPHLDCGDYVVVINAAQVKLTGKKELQKKYYRHSGYPGGFRVISYSEQKTKDPRRIIELAVSRMLPKNKLQKARLRRLKVCADEKHPYKDKFKNN
ncbi:50S ribosomal protein L13 [Candidatus Beckwithbacteria bacterium RBG_13_42_9]|uniref:Large ribosomal subunit protein uL13 n=1 Tax=Candidatus Beckwithbacteria bacterium RBG_13_42_9 TaxID=1797457 RepID=A0A1F5E8V3_9BACT|nr:MAG: 50S ribosomal protein L13 [Candidatus Beckwithbacteria bacterium RBG_13_42_9]